MGSSGKTRTTYAKLNRESKLRDKRAEKEARKAARKLNAVGGATDPGSELEALGSAPVEPETSVPDGAQVGPVGGDSGI